MENTSINAEERATRGKGAARQMRRDGRIPAVVYGKGREPQALSINGQEFHKILVDLKGEIKSTVFDLQVGKKTATALVRELQRHPTKLSVQHVDFYEIHAGEKIHLEVPVHLTGIADGVRNGGGVLDQGIREILVEVLPRHIPDHFELDVTDLAVGKSLQVGDIPVENATVLTDLDTTVCSVIPPRIEEEEEEEEEGIEELGEMEEPELIRKPKAEEEDGDTEE
jgi:large subunit ribosomal protein L25